MKYEIKITWEILQPGVNLKCAENSDIGISALAENKRLHCTMPYSGTGIIAECILFTVSFPDKCSKNQPVLSFLTWSQKKTQYTKPGRKSPFNRLFSDFQWDFLMATLSSWNMLKRMRLHYHYPNIQLDVELSCL